MYNLDTNYNEAEILEESADWDGIHRHADGTPVFECDWCMDLGCDACPQSEEGAKAQMVLAGQFPTVDDDPWM